MFRYRCIQRTSKRRWDLPLRRHIAISLVALFVVPFGGSVPVLAQQQSVPSQPAGGMPPPPAPSPSSGSTGEEQGVSRSADGNQPSQLPNAVQEQPQSGPPAPVGTAVAPYEAGVGVAASRPAGAVIAPAKQRRTRSFMIKVGLLIGAAAAVGTVVGLSAASPSRPH
jgi:hypothetical protein